MSIQFSGLGSGLDFSSWVEQLVAAKQATSVTPLETKKTELENQSSALSTIKTSFTNLQSALKNFTSIITGTDNDIWGNTTITSSADKYVTATSTSGLATGDIKISVEQLATNTVAQSVSNPGKLITEDTLYSQVGNNQSKDGTFSFYVDNKRYEIEIDKTKDTMGDIVNKINDAAGGKVEAKINSDGTFEIASTGGEKISVGSFSDTSNFASIMKLTDSTGTSVKSAYVQTSILTNKAMSSEESGLSETVTSGTIKINGVEFEINENTSLQDLINKINTTEDAKVSAKYDTLTNKLVFTSKESGEFNISLEAEGTNFFDVFGLTKDGALADGSQTLGQNAILTVNGNKIVSSSNTVTSESTGINGLTINALKVTDGSDEDNTTEVTLNAKSDLTEVKSAIKEFIDAYNKITEQIDTATAQDGYLKMDINMRSIQTELRNIVGSIVSDNGSFGMLAQIGISTGDAGLDVSNSATTLVFDEEAFDKAWAKDSNSVKNLISGGYSGDKTGIFDQMLAKVENTLDPTNGMFAIKSESVSRLISTQEDRITRAYASLESYETQLTKKFQYMDEMISKLQQQYSSFIS